MKKTLTSFVLCALAVGMSGRLALAQSTDSSDSNNNQQSPAAADSDSPPPPPQSPEDSGDADADDRSQELQRQQQRSSDDADDQRDLEYRNQQSDQEDSASGRRDQFGDQEEEESNNQRDGRYDDSNSESSRSREADDDERWNRERRQDNRDRNQRIQSAADLNAEFNAADDGLELTQINQSSVLASAGLRQGDVLVSVQGRPLRSEADFIRWYRTFPVGTRVPLVVLRGGQRRTIYLTNDWGYDRGFGQNYNRGYDNRPNYGGAYLGVVFDDRYPDQAIVEVVRRNTAADQAGLRPGDTIQAINGRRVRGLEHATQLVAGMQPGEEIDITFARRSRTTARLGSRAEGAQVSYEDYDRDSNYTRYDRTETQQIDRDYRDFEDGRFGDRDDQYDRDGFGDNGPVRRALPRPFRDE